MIHFTLVESAHGSISKVISKQEDGTIKSDGSVCCVVRGQAFRRTVADEAEFALLINAMPSNTAVVMGQLRADLPDTVNVATGAAVAEMDSGALSAVPTIARSQEYLVYAAKTSAWMLIDVDGKYLTEPVRTAIAALAAGEPLISDDPRFLFAATVLAALNKLFPGIGTAGAVIRRSTSAGIVDTETGMPGPGNDGCHIYLKVSDGADVARALRSMHDRLFFHGLSWLGLGSVGQYLERSIVDRTVGGPEHLAFEGAPQVVLPLTQDPQQRVPLYRPGVALDTRAVIPPLIRDNERAELTRIKQQLRDALALQRAAAREACRAQRVVDMVARGVSEEVARRSLDRMLVDGIPVLDPYQVLYFDDPDLGEITVADVLQNSQRYLGQTLADPFEGISYGRCKSKVMVKREGGLFINSFAHGGMRYDLKYDDVHLRQLLDAMDAKQRPEAFARLYPWADLSAVELERLRQEVAKSGGIGLRALSALMKVTVQERERISREVAAEERQRERQARGDLRAEYPTPPLDGEIGVVMDLLNDAMRPFLNGPVPPMRGENTGRLVRLSERISEDLQVISQVHQLTATGANDLEAESKLPRLPPVGYTRLTTVQEADLPEYLETYARFFNAVGLPVRLPAPYVRPFLIRSFDQTLPVAKGVITAPVVLPDGELTAGQYFDRRLGLLVRTPPELTPFLPTTAQCTPRAVANEMKFLFDEFLVDVSTDLNGKALAVAMMGTIIERMLLPARPGFMATAGQQAAGKTSLMHGISQAVLGRFANAAPWATSEEERRKRLTAVFLAAHPFVVWDNIRAGSILTCQKVGLSLTSPTFNDRILGLNEEADAPTHTVQAWTGNNISAGGELASRILMIYLRTLRLYAENRQYVHPDFMGWVQIHRARILRAVYTILLGNFHGHVPDHSQSVTRFPDWYRLVGSAVERAMEQYCHYHGHGDVARFSFGELFQGLRAEAVGTDGLSALHQLIARTRHQPDPSRPAEPVGLWRDGFTMADAVDLAQQPTSDATEFNQLLAAISGLPVLTRPSANQVERRFRSVIETPSNIFVEDGRSETVCIDKRRNPHDGVNTYRLRML